MPEDQLKVVSKPPMGGLKKGILANQANYKEAMRSVDPLTVPNRLGLVLDDSTSMGTEGMDNAHKAVKGFTDSCNALETSIAVYPLTKESKALTCDYDLLNMYVLGIGPTGGTPLYGTLQKLIVEQKITRAIAFSDGGPTDSQLLESDSFFSRGSALAHSVVRQFIEKEVPVDTIFIGEKESNGHNELQELSLLTGGTCVHFTDMQTLGQSLKYLAPKFRALLANPEIKARIERGEQI